MNTKTTWIALAVVAVIAIGGWLALAAMPAAAPTVPETATSTAGGPEAQAPAGPGAQAPVGTTSGPATVIVSYTDSGFYPNSVTVRVGDTVRFANQSSHDMWVASDAHPTHSEYDGTSTQQHCNAGAANNGTFDECKAVKAGGTYEYTFRKAGTHEYHNHVRAADTGTVVVN